MDMYTFRLVYIFDLKMRCVYSISKLAYRRIAREDNTITMSKKIGKKYLSFPFLLT